MPVAGDTVSIASSRTHVSGHKTRTRELDILPLPGQEQLAVPDEKIEDPDDWEHDPNNPRNWSSLKKWTATSLVGIRLSFPCIPSCDSHRSPYTRSLLLSRVP
jgi:hypothetical protein